MFRKWWNLGLISLVALVLDISPMSAPMVHALSAPAIKESVCGWDTTPGWVARENAKKGDARWGRDIPVQYGGDYRVKRVVVDLSRWPSHTFVANGVHGWFDATSATCGQQVGLHIVADTNAVTIKVFRMGYYGGAGARLVSTDHVKRLPGESIPKISPAPESTVTTNWNAAYSLKITQSTPPGQYLIRLNDEMGNSSFVPITIFDAEIKSSITFVSSVLTWQAYNAWGGYSLYKGPNQSRATRANIVSFDRPYDGDGSGQFRYLEYPIVKLAEKLGIDMNYVTDVELDRNIASLQTTKSILLGGHAEYWTSGMRDSLQRAVSQGVNLVSLGGNAGYNRPRLSSHNRELVMWRSSSADIFSSTSSEATKPWRDQPISRPESTLLGAEYVGLGVNGDYTITHPNRWPFSTTKKIERLDSVVGREVDSPLYAVGPGVEILAWSDIHMDGRRLTSMATYYTNVKKAGILDISTNGWTCAIDNVCPWLPSHSQQTQRDVRIITEEILKGLTRGPLGLWRPALVDLPPRSTALSFRVEASNMKRVGGQGASWKISSVND